ncbi:MFS transporter [uncultured Tenacibaculum sp.]|uniref:MFS transporter n=1 Tax=uncultured Tenacibaculum sp. TaxID=174713 RepID=UPI0026328017|nr:MFS transporter [uncultured Tenacibaculum sp.]
MNFRKILQFTLLILAAEIIYALPFVLIRIFRPTFLAAFDIDNKSIGFCFSLYGITAMISYFIGGLIADKFQPKYLMSIALLLTGLGGLVWVYYPSLETLYLLYVYWGVTSIMLFWSPLIKSVRILGEKKKQILAFSIVEGGRGLVAAIIGTIGIIVITAMIPDEDSSKEMLQGAMNKIYLITSVLIILMSFLMLLLPNFGDTSKIISKNKIGANIIKALKYPVVWILMVIILTSYIGYRVADVFTQYASEIYGYNARESAELGIVYSYLRPVVCILIIFFARKANPSKWLIIGFSVMSFGSLLLVFNEKVLHLSLLIPILSALTGTYTLRVLYFTVLEDAKIPITITGTVVGILSVVGFSPDIFLGFIEGYYLDEVGGVLGFQFLFVFLLVSSIIGLFASILFYNSIKSRNKLLSS